MTDHERGQLFEHKANGVYTATTEPLNSRWSFLLAASGIAMTIGTGIPAGYNIGVLNSPAKIMTKWCNRTIIDQYDIELTESQLAFLWSTITSIFSVGGCAGSIAAAKLADKFGRKGALLICAILFGVGAVSLYLCRVLSSVEMLLLARFIVGLSSGVTTAVLGMYLAEIAPSELRGTLATLSGLGVTAGVVVAQVITLQEIFGNEELWHYALSAYIILIVICFLPFPWYPESPKYLYIVANKREMARKQLMRLRVGDGGDEYMSRINAELYAMHQEANSQGETRSLWSVLTDKTLLLPIVLVCALQAGQQLSGVNVVFVYSVLIFMNAGLSEANSKWANLGAGLLNLLVAFAGPKVMQKFNRRPVIILSCSFSGLFLVMLAFFYNNVSAFSWFPMACVVSILAYIFFFQIGLGPIPYFIGSELFEISTRPAAMAIGSLASWFANFSVGISYLPLETIFGGYVFLPFAVVCFSLVALCYVYLPESRGKEPSDLAPLMTKGFSSRRR